MSGQGEHPAASDDAYGLTPDRIRAVVGALGEGRIEQAVELVEPLHSADIADLIDLIGTAERRLLIEAMRGVLDPEVLAELSEEVAESVVEQLGPVDVAAAVTELETDDAVDLLEDLDEAGQRQVLDAVPVPERAHIEAALAYPEDSAGRLMQRDLIAVPAFWTVGQTIDYMRDSDDLPDEFYEIFVVDPTHRPIGTVPLNRIMRTKRPVLVSAIMEAEPIRVEPGTDQEEVAYLFQQYDLASGAVVDASGRLIGVIMVDDVVDVIHEEAEEDILRLAGVSETDINASIRTTTQRRFIWLLINLMTAILASAVIAQFDAAIEKIVALAILMPIVASMGGNAGTQTMAVAVRGLATRELTVTNARRIVDKELVVGFFNGVLFALLVGLVAGFWFADAALGGVIAAAMVINMLVAALSGILVPLGFDRMGVDPAVASSVFVTTITDVVGFLAFLGLAAGFLL